MISARNTRIGLAIVLPLLLVAGIAVVVHSIVSRAGRTHVIAYFDNSNAIFRGDAVMLLGVRIGEIDKIEPEPTRAKITFWFDDKYQVPADARAVILSPQLITSRAIALTPAYTGGPQMGDGAVIPQDRTAVPVEWDDFRKQLEKLDSSLQPAGRDQVSPLGAFINTTANNLRGQGAAIRDAIIKLSQAFSALGDHSNDLFSTIKNLSIVVSALQSSTDVMKQLNGNLAAVTGLLANNTDEVGQAVADINMAARDVQSFVADNREAIGTTSDKLASISKALVESLDDIKQALAYCAHRVSEPRQHLRAHPFLVDRGAGSKQLRQPDHVFVRSDSGGVAAWRRAVGQAVRPVPGADHQKPAIQLPAVGG